MVVLFLKNVEEINLLVPYLMKDFVYLVLGLGRRRTKSKRLFFITYYECGESQEYQKSYSKRTYQESKSYDESLYARFYFVFATC